MWNWLKSRVNIWVILGALVVAGLLIGAVAALLFFYPLPDMASGKSAALLTVIPAPSMTPTPQIATIVSTEGPSGEIIGGIGIGMYVQISGTEGDGLRLRSGPSRSDDPRFLGYESEVFMVKDGPRLSDDLTWWFLEAPYDPGRSGWAASQYLAVVGATPTPSP